MLQGSASCWRCCGRKTHIIEAVKSDWRKHLNGCAKSSFYRKGTMWNLQDLYFSPLYYEKNAQLARAARQLWLQIPLSVSVCQSNFPQLSIQWECGRFLQTCDAPRRWQQQEPWWKVDGRITALENQCKLWLRTNSSSTFMQKCRFCGWRPSSVLISFFFFGVKKINK